MNSIGGYDVEDITLGMSASFTKTVTEGDIILFCGVSGDCNPVHIDAEFAKTTAFGGRIAHGMLSASFISNVLGMKLPGPGVIYLGQTLRFKAPVRIGDTVTATATVTEVVPEKRRVVLNTVCTVAGKPVIEGEATMLATTRKGS